MQNQIILSFDVSIRVMFNEKFERLEKEEGFVTISYAWLKGILYWEDYWKKHKA